MKTKRPTLLIITSLLLILSALLSWGTVLLKINEGDPGLAILVTVGVIEGVLSLVAAAGVFAIKRWALWLAVVLSGFGIFTSISGIVLWDGLPKALCIVGAMLNVLVILLAVLPSARHPYVTRPAVTGEKAN